ncbi:MAG: translation initiation factor [Thaumarchaeota archaeon]|jgi:translation initiation factor 1|nr:translation initiation factor [Candidatus Geocrenenecus arthurdayi]MCL7389104.1 translation initiation factor [Candidatus Geocrenenecus arthurdayi]MCL7390790.1 translation initiation factor [Candidatus Geocrenenecus arthurdayi]MCL7396866.1 translation initiation factor [Candidatus Geocrenenecus arthurdayi]MCL7401777.1 translation initiation factor [Candidatus Geocrenenecus arthurdayi]
MPEICPVCGLPKSICVCKTISREQQRIKVKLETRKWGRPVTIIEGLDGDKNELEQLARKLKSLCASGGTVKNGVILLQGDHRDKVKEVLLSMGHSEENIEVV